MFTRKQLEVMTKDALVALALAEFGEDLKPSMAKTDVVEKLLELQGGEPDAAEGAADVDVVESAPVLAAAEGERKFRVTIFEARDEPAFVDLSVNGDAIRIKRGLEVVIGERFVNVLRSAVQTLHEGVEQGDGMIKMVQKQTPRFAYSAEAV